MSHPVGRCMPSEYPAALATLLSKSFYSPSVPSLIIGCTNFVHRCPTGQILRKDCADSLFVASTTWHASICSRPNNCIGVRQPVLLSATIVCKYNIRFDLIFKGFRRRSTIRGAAQPVEASTHSSVNTLTSN